MSAGNRAIQAALEGEAEEARFARDFAKARRWYRASTLDVFDRQAAGGAAWVAPARVALEAAVRDWMEEPRRSGDEPMIIWREAQRAIQLGCGDALVLYVHAQNLAVLEKNNTSQIAQAARAAAKAMENSAYPPVRKFYAAMRGAEHVAAALAKSEQDKSEVARFVERGQGLFGQVIADPELPRIQLIDMFKMIGDVSLTIYGDRRKLTAPMFDAASASKIDRSSLLTVQGVFNIGYAWDARGTGMASTITPDMDKAMTQRVEKAQKALEEAWNLDPSNSYAAAAMIEVELLQGKGRGRMELWYQRAMAANPDNIEACRHKLNYLQPKWYGSVEDMVSFGRQCAATGNWEAGLPMILVDAHRDAAHYTEGGYSSRLKTIYLRSDAAVWHDIDSVLSQAMERGPRSDFRKLRFAQLAAWSHHWAEADRLFREVGDLYDPRVYSTQKKENEDRAAAAAHVHGGAASEPAEGL